MHSRLLNWREESAVQERLSGKGEGGTVRADVIPPTTHCPRRAGVARVWRRLRRQSSRKSAIMTMKLASVSPSRSGNRTTNSTSGPQTKRYHPTRPIRVRANGGRSNRRVPTSWRFSRGRS